MYTTNALFIVRTLSYFPNQNKAIGWARNPEVANLSFLLVCQRGGSRGNMKETIDGDRITGDVKKERFILNSTCQLNPIT